MHTEASKLHTDSVEALEAKEKQNHISPIIHQFLLKPMLILKILLKQTIIAKFSIWLLDCSLKQPQAASMEFGSDRKTSRILMPNKSLIVIYYCGFLIGF